MDLGSAPSLRHVDAAAEFIAGRLAEGKRAAFSSIGHLVLYEATQDLVSPMFGFRSNSGYRSRVFPLALGRGDVLVWIGYTSPSSRWADYLCGIRESGTDIVYSAAPSMPANPVPDGTKAIVPQHWLLPDAEVAIPAPPGAMAPLSEVDRCVVVKMIDCAVAAKLAERGVSVPKCAPRDAAAFAALDDEVGPRFPPPRAPESKKPFHGYARWRRWHDDRVLVCRDGRWGLADGNGVLLAPVRYENMRIASDHLLATQVGDKYGVVDRDGREVIAPSLQCVLPPWKWLQVKVAFMQDGKFGILDPVTGSIATPATFAKYPAAPVQPPSASAPVDFSGWSREFMP